MFLNRAAEASREEAARRRPYYPPQSLLRTVKYLPPAQPLSPRLASRDYPLLIAEIKRASPSRGTFAAGNVEDLARIYRDHGAGAISVLTPERFFQGSLRDLERARAVTDLPLLRKDFLTGEYQLLEARARGADLVLLLAALLDRPALESLLAAARELGLECLVEVHSRRELEKVLELPVTLVGINHRDLTTLEVRPETTRELAPLVPPDLPLVAESGIRTGADVRRLAGLGAKAVLVGESLLEAPCIAGKVRELAGGANPGERTGLL